MKIGINLDRVDKDKKTATLHFEHNGFYLEHACTSNFDGVGKIKSFDTDNGYLVFNYTGYDEDDYSEIKGELDDLGVEIDLESMLEGVTEDNIKIDNNTIGIQDKDKFNGIKYTLDKEAGKKMGLPSLVVINVIDLKNIKYVAKLSLYEGEIAIISSTFPESKRYEMLYGAERLKKYF